jgi:Rieske Fe-S protein
LSKKETSRRDFINWILGGSAAATLGAVVYPVVRFINPPASGEANVSQLKLPFKRSDIEAEPSRGKTFKFGRDLGIIIMTDSGELKAFTATCTHLDCTVQHRPDLGILWCSCHNGRYGLDGSNISGPPPRPLESFVVNEEGEDIFVKREEA